MSCRQKCTMRMILLASLLVYLLAPLLEYLLGLSHHMW